MTKTTRTIVHVALIAFIAITVALSMRTHTEPQFSAQYATQESVLSTFPMCEHEYSVNCVWDAQKQGNGKGASFVAIDTPEGLYNLYSDGTVEYFGK